MIAINGPLSLALMAIIVPFWLASLARIIASMAIIYSH